MSHGSTLERRHHARHRAVPRRPGGAERLTDLADAVSRSTLESILRSLDDLSGVVEGVLDVMGRRGVRTDPSDFLGAGPHGRHHGHGHRHGHGHHHDCGCSSDDCCDDGPWCGPDPCVCLCCVGDVDLEIRARVGERRVVPLRIENTRSRERTVSLQLSDWHRRGGGEGEFPVHGQLDRLEFTIAPCSVERVTLVVTASGQRDGEEGKLPDVDTCTVYYSDLRIEGCDTRPVRIALVLLPRDCDEYEITCSCSCC